MLIGLFKVKTLFKKSSSNFWVFWLSLSTTANRPLNSKKDGEINLLDRLIDWYIDKQVDRKLDTHLDSLLNKYIDYN